MTVLFCLGSSLVCTEPRMSPRSVEITALVELSTVFREISQSRLLLSTWRRPRRPLGHCDIFVDSSNLVVAGEAVLGQAAVQRGHTVAAQQQEEDSEGAAR